MLTGIAENEGESSDDNDDIDEGEAMTPKRKEWLRSNIVLFLYLFMLYSVQEKYWQ